MVLADHDAAEDIAQIIFTRLWVSGGWRTIEHPSTYFRRAARHEAQRLRARWLRLADLVEPLLSQVDPFTSAWEREVRQTLTPALASLPPQVAQGHEPLAVPRLDTSRDRGPPEDGRGGGGEAASPRLQAAPEMVRCTAARACGGCPLFRTWGCEGLETL